MDISNHTDDAPFRQACRRVVRGLVERHDWALLPEEALVELLLESTQPGTPPTDLERTAKHHYTIVLYEACRQTEDPRRRGRAYHELFRYLFRAAYNRWPDLAEDATQRALVLVCEQIERCRHPGAFLAFALYKLQHALQQERRARGRDWPVGELDRESTDEDMAAFRLRLARQERLQVVVEALRRLQDERQQKTIAFKFLEGLSDEEIATHLGIAVGYVRVLRHRGLARLRKDKQLRECLELGDGEEI